MLKGTLYSCEGQWFHIFTIKPSISNYSKPGMTLPTRAKASQMFVLSNLCYKTNHFRHLTRERLQGLN